MAADLVGNGSTVAVWTREFTPDDLSGRMGLIAALRRGPLAGAIHERVCSLTECRRWWTWPLVPMRLLLGLLSGRPVPLQVMLFHDRGEVARVADAVVRAAPQAVYLDGIRAAPVVAALRRRGCRARLVVDFDDLMSRRMRLAHARGEAPNPGYLAKLLPAPAHALLGLGWFGGLVLRYEAWSLAGLERRLLRQVDAVVLLSSADAGAFRRAVVGESAASQRRIQVIPPPAQPVDPACLARPVTAPRRCVFIGSDVLSQNRLVLERLVGWWRAWHPTMELHWYGKQTRAWDLPPGVVAHGYAPSLEAVYDGSSVLLYPAQVGGGIKTKLLEALARGCPVVVNRLALEGLDWDDYPLVLEDEAAWRSFLGGPASRVEDLTRALMVAADHLSRDHDPGLHAARWTGLLTGSPVAEPPALGALPVLQDRRVAIVHEWMVSYSGSERVVEQLLKLAPHAEVFALVDLLPDGERGFLGGRIVHTSALQRMPGFLRRRFRGFLPLMPFLIEQLDLSAFDVVLSSNHAVAKGVLCGPHQVHLCYCHSPMRYAWDLQHQYLHEMRLGWGPVGLLTRASLHYLRSWDHRSAQAVDAVAANSAYIARRIRRAWGRESTVVHPPVAVDEFILGEDKEPFYLAASRLVTYKHVPLVVEAFAAMPGRRLVVVGDGPERPRIEAIARRHPNIEYLGRVDPARLKDLLRRARALVFAAEEDFGILPVEALASGTPVIAYARGGVAETVEDGASGVLFDHQTTTAVQAAVIRFEAITLLPPAALRERARRFAPHHFRARMGDFITRQLETASSRTMRAFGAKR